MIIEEAQIDGVKLIKPTVFNDNRGFFLETFHLHRYKQAICSDLKFVQDNHSLSRKGVLRGLHLQKCKPQGKLVRVTRGEIFDVAADVRPSSPTYGQWVGFTLSEENKDQLWIPPGLAHGFLVLSDVAEIEYKCTDYYDPESEQCIVWNDPFLNIKWPDTGAYPILSEKDSKAITLKELTSGN